MASIASKCEHTSFHPVVSSVSKRGPGKSVLEHIPSQSPTLWLPGNHNSCVHSSSFSIEESESLLGLSIERWRHSFMAT